MLRLQIITDRFLYEPAVLSGMSWETVRKSSPGKMKFTTIRDPDMKFAEGDVVAVYNGNDGFFKGVIFTTSFSEDEKIDIVAYDQLRYFKNKDTRNYKSKTADGLLKLIAQDYGLAVGGCDDTGYPISRVEDDEELFSIMENAVYDTLVNTGKLYVLYDDFGLLRLREISNMKIPLLIDGETAGSYTYKSTIDSDTYNAIRLTYTDNDSGKKTYYASEDKETQKKWGVLQYTQNIDTQEGANLRAKSMLQMYNTPLKTLKIKDCIGDIRVRAGTAILLKRNPDQDPNWMIVEKAVHNFKDGFDFMDLTLKGGDING